MNNYNLNKNFLYENFFYIEKLYQKFLVNPNSIEKKWKYFFINFEKKKKVLFQNNQLKNNDFYKKNLLVEKINQLINNFRIFGHYDANINPLFFNKKKLSNILQLKNYDINKKDFQKKISLNSLFENQKIIDIYNFFKKKYCHHSGIEYFHLLNHEKYWIQKNIELMVNNLQVKEKKIFFEELIATEIFETNIAKNFPGIKRFSLEGCDILIPIIKEIIRYSSKLKNKITKIILSMAHRGRLNVLANIMGKNIKEIKNEFKNILLKNNDIDDVKYHLGYSSIIINNNKKIKLKLTFNPSHLEIINSVSMGIIKSYIDSSKENNIIPINIHGDASFSGQGIIQEILNLSQTRGYGIGGTIHIIINNQIGFTTSKISDMRSSYYCTDIAKMIQCPIFHINADDIENAILIIRLALTYRDLFKKDVFIDLVSYRRHGHNEIDDPYITQPLMYNYIKNHETIQNLYFKKLFTKNILNIQEKKDIYQKYQNLFNKDDFFIKTYVISKKNILKKIFKKLTINELKKLIFKISNFPENFNIHSRVQKIFKDRLSMSKDKKKVDWGTAENLAYANILTQGISCRLSGEDIKRGTFSHRHAVIYDQKNGISYIPLKNLSLKQGKFYIYNSILSEEAVLGFEYGYSLNKKNILTIWEAQFGDFVNGAQIIIDQFISSGEKKWKYQSKLIVMLPHGYEGQGPEHSSARIERFLQLSAENNMKICIPSYASQIYHLLCEQAFNYIKKPLIIFMPKSLLRYNLACSSLKYFINNFELIIDELDKNINIKNIKRVVFCSGKIYYDLLEYRNSMKEKNIILIRIEQLYPFPYNNIKKIIKKYLKINNFIWCQEEPKNQGAWTYIQNNFKNKLNLNIHYIGRKSSSSPSTGHLSIHKKQQHKIIFSVFNI
ncbi:2-oxoglutarate dehydrogenase E1 component [Enterobacteriaceae endosymbiont of Donacia cincticornis]|uniref:2-oxoglutarate dehydrogenase E1 component n=1 Tax=Enterobacteriaceae endosymbiont of Donacia cincticornis TaxID=2675773 RepID=UPI00144A0956|nr:2-oxoglutarate dehydrogenase E1 component [Enterobacteriaceae endosymbiont of Donacia cincticornis]QJC36087.1 2-oxoglutarate dehydrogenase E1 component [Enterobacteriaceae endosymbiont of Donacia cincticornis]